MSRIYFQTDRKELDRRWELVQAAMKKEGIDALILASLERVFGGPAKYLTDINCTNYAKFYLFCNDGFYAYSHGNPCDKKTIDGLPLSEYVLRDKVLNIKHCITAPGFSFTEKYVALDMVDDIKKHGFKKIGFCSMLTIPAAIYKYVTESLPDVEFVNFTETIDRIRAIKSEYEIARIQRNSKIHDEMMEYATKIVHIGKTEREIRIAIEKMSMEAYSAIANVMVGFNTGPMWPEHANEMITDKGVLALVIETSTMGGLWSEIARTFVFGDPTPSMLKAEKDGLYLEKYVADRCKIGAIPEQIFEEGQKVATELGYTAEPRLWGHGHTYCLLERPVLAKGETMPLSANMVFSIHPSFFGGEIFVNSNDFLLTENGMERLTEFPNGYIYQNY
jgi:Xaa-Pro aminopeptidase